jgi:hypothetical protein
MAIYIFGEFTVTSVVEFLKRAALYSARFSFDFVDARDSSSHVLILKHDRGRPWSRYYLGLLDETFHVLLGEHLKTAYTETMCVGQLRLRSREERPRSAFSR